jgi:hypothetical protein
MTTQTTSQRSPIRAFLVAIAVLLASVFATGPAAASTNLIAMTDMGGPGGGGGSAASTVDIADYQVPGVSGALPF